MALQLAAVDPSLGGVLLRGPRGTAKSTMARGLAAWIGDSPFVELPLGADEDKLIGSLDLQAALHERAVRAEPGLLARAHDGVLYADEVNLLPDHLVDLLLDAAACGVVRVEREGVSHRFDAAFVLVGTMNPDEGELRPQLLDRFGLCADVSTPVDVRERTEVLRQRMAWQHDRRGFLDRFAESETLASARVQAARACLHSVDTGSAIDWIAADCAVAGAEGLRGDIAWLAAARAHAALQCRREVTAEDIGATRTLALRHRLPEEPPEPPGGRRPGDSRTSRQARPADSPPSISSAAIDTRATHAVAAVGRGASGQSRVSIDRVGTPRLIERGQSVAWARSIARAAGLPSSEAECHYRIRQRRQGGAWVVLLDCSASMLRANALARTQGAVLKLLRSAYWQRRQVSVLRFAGDCVETLHPLGRVPKDATDFVRVVQAGGATPLADGLIAVREILRRASGCPADMQLWLFTDGKVSHADLPRPGCAVTVVDAQAARSDDARRLANALGAQLCTVDDLRRPAA